MMLGDALKSSPAESGILEDPNFAGLVARMATLRLRSLCRVDRARSQNALVSTCDRRLVYHWSFPRLVSDRRPSVLLVCTYRGVSVSPLYCNVAAPWTAPLS